MELLPGEQLMFQDHAAPAEHGVSDEDVNARYSRGEVRIVTEQARYPLTAISGMVDSDDYELNPDFQRRHRWDVVRKSRLIESFIMNVPIPPIFLYEARYSFYEVMDGLQRLTAIRDFYADQYALTGLQEWSDLNGRTYSELPTEVKRGVDRRYLSSIILLHETAKSDEEAGRLKQLVFERINSGGERLTAQESRNAIWPGPMNSLCLELSRNEDLCALWHIPTEINDEATLAVGDSGSLAGHTLFRTMGDVELVLRFFAYRQQLDRQEGRTLRDYLDDYLRQGNGLPHEDLATLKDVFERTVALVRGVLGEQALYMYKVVRGEWRYTRPTLTVYDPIMWAFSNRLEDADGLLQRTSAARRAFEEMFVEHASAFSGRTAEHADIKLRNQLFTELIDQTLTGSVDTVADTASDPSAPAQDEADEFLDVLVAEELALTERAAAGSRS